MDPRVCHARARGSAMLVRKLADFGIINSIEGNCVWGNSLKLARPLPSGIHPELLSVDPKVFRVLRKDHSPQGGKLAGNAAGELMPDNPWLGYSGIRSSLYIGKSSAGALLAYVVVVLAVYNGRLAGNSNVATSRIHISSGERVW
ncbi:hypothetical protein DFH07DRAFT_936115 [Mycena maculata]|uniref:Uncharacterized protein n=1 Tax=Mycena maculata TaxID=230809 RepID=A0AAD7K9V5_9AGAR|nr:hypothetical protein DFH07DRAFT_936115 [Mycena maculata]